MLSPQSDGYVRDLADGVAEPGSRGVFPPGSAGTRPAALEKRRVDRPPLTGGCDARTTFGHGERDRVASEIRRNLDIFDRGGGFIFIASHMPMADRSLDGTVFTRNPADEPSR